MRSALIIDTIHTIHFLHRRGLRLQSLVTFALLESHSEHGREDWRMDTTAVAG